MATQSRSTFKKRQREMARHERRQEKLARRLQRNKERQETAEKRTGDVDPDIAGIVPGPQPPSDVD